MKDQMKHQVATYYFPNYHQDNRNRQLHGEGWTEWDLVTRAEPRFENHRQPRVPTWGYEDESDPAVMAKKIDLAADHSVDTFIFDWYWYNDGPFLNRALDEGFLNAPNIDRIKFALMWANHDWIDIHPAKATDEPCNLSRKILYPGSVDDNTFDTIINYCIDNYFKHPSYWTIDGCPYFSIYELSKFMDGAGSLEAAAELLARFRKKTKEAGFPDLHLNAIIWGKPILPGETTPADPFKLVKDLGFDSVTSYVWVHHGELNHFPSSSFESLEEQYFDYWETALKRCSLPYYPNLTMGWDPSPRTVQSDPFINRHYPFSPVINDNTPERFEKATRRIKKRMDELNNRNSFVTVNAWNEWTEGSYLEPDTEHGTAYLEAIRNVFKSD